MSGQVSRFFFFFWILILPLPFLLIVLRIPGVDVLDSIYVR